MKKALVLGAGGFIGSHLAKRLKREGCWVRGVDLKYPEFSKSEADDFMIGDLRNPLFCYKIFDRCFDEVYQLAAEMGGAGYVFTGDNDADILHNSVLINLNILSIFQKNHPCHFHAFKRIFYSSSVCVYSDNNQGGDIKEKAAYPAHPRSDYGWEKLFSERLYLAFHRNYGVDVHIARYQNTFGPEGTWRGGREKAPAAICRKIAEAEEGGEVEIWGDGKQTRSFIYIDENLEGTLRIMRSNHTGPFNLGTDEKITIDEFASMIIQIADKKISIKYIPGPEGAKLRISDNRLLHKMLGWRPNKPIIEGLKKTYPWVLEQVNKNKDND